MNHFGVEVGRVTPLGVPHYPPCTSWKLAPWIAGDTGRVGR